MAANEGLGFCLSERGDLLSQWRGYAAQGRGVSIAFRPIFLNAFLLQMKQMRISPLWSESSTARGTVDDEVVDRFAHHDCICPGTFTIRGHRDGHCQKRVGRFVRYLATTGVVAGQVVRPGSELTLPLAAFQEWMRRHRGTGERTMTKHLHLLRRVLPELGPDPGQYDAALVRSAILQRASAGSRFSAQATTTALRMCFRYLASTGQCARRIQPVDAIPTMPRWRLATLPRYIVHDDVERVIASCDLTVARGMRDHAILLLLARLGRQGLVATALGRVVSGRPQLCDRTARRGRPP